MEKDATGGVTLTVTKPFLITGHPRCGTGYMAQLMHSFGFYVGHEKILEDGISSWLFAIEGYQPWVEAVNRKDYAFDHVIVVVRNPVKALASITYTENMIYDPLHQQYRLNQQSLEYRQQAIRLPEIHGIDTCVQAAVQSYIKWYQLVLEQEYDLLVQVEEAPQQLFSWLDAVGYPVPEEITLPSPQTNSRPHPSLSKAQIQRFANAYEWEQLENMSQEFGYEI